MKGIVGLITILGGLSIIGLSLESSPQTAAAPDPLFFQYNAGQAVLGAAIALIGLLSLKRS